MEGEQYKRGEGEKTGSEEREEKRAGRQDSRINQLIRYAVVPLKIIVCMEASIEHKYAQICNITYLL